jgi:hypothetical protein
MNMSCHFSGSVSCGMLYFLNALNPFGYLGLQIEMCK